MPPKLRLEASEFDPVGEPLKGFRPPTLLEILTLRNFYKNQDFNLKNRDLAEKVYPESLALWQKVHCSLPLRTKASIINQLIEHFTKIDKCRQGRANVHLLAGVRSSLKKVFNFTTCRCKLPEVLCKKANCEKNPEEHYHILYCCPQNKVTPPLQSYYILQIDKLLMKKSYFRFQNLKEFI